MLKKVLDIKTKPEAQQIPKLKPLQKSHLQDKKKLHSHLTATAVASREKYITRYHQVLADASYP